MLEKDYSGLFDFCSGPCELGDILQIVGIVVIFVAVVAGFLTLVHRKIKHGDYSIGGGGP